MEIWDGCRRYNLYWFEERSRSGEFLSFQTREAGLFWLTSLQRWRADLIAELRTVLAYRSPIECFRLSDAELLQCVAQLLYTGRLLVVAELETSTRAQGSGKPAREPAAFPLDQRTPARAVSSARRLEEDPPTFSQNMDMLAQLAALVGAASRGVPFCPE
jgi:hypothetical protein